ncbi:MAG TPA: YdcF family protein [Aggregatilineales bacterium]|nr:YdcF family protein [Anaerolineales bacterium]HRE49073.1 YdcF family protein [Aggregatilineales bacterium]
MGTVRIANDSAKRRRSWQRGIIIGLVALILLPLGFALYIYSYGQVDRAAPAAVIIVLGAGTRPSGAPSPSHIRRIDHALALYKQGLAPAILCTGGYTDRHPNSEARACQQRLEAFGVPASAIFLEEKSLSTEENALESKPIMAQQGWQTALLVSDSYHLWRAEMLFRAQGISVVSSPAQVTSGGLHWRTALSNTLREVAAAGWYVFKTLLGLPITNF